MAIYNQNYRAVNLVSGTTYSTYDLGNAITGSCVHQVFCLAAGSINISPLGGGNFTWVATASEYMDILVGKCTVNSGVFIGFKSQYQPGQMQLPNTFWL